MFLFEFICFLTASTQYIALGLSPSEKDKIGRNLSDFLKSNLLSGSRPTGVPGTKLNVNVTAALYQIVDIDQRRNLATVSAYFDLRWELKRLKWDPSDFAGTKETFLSSHEIWVPELYLYHSVQASSSPLIQRENAIEVKHSGKIRVFVPFTAEALCPINVKYFPFDTQKCEFVFGSWSFTEKLIEYSVDNPTVLLIDFYDNQEWMLKSCRLTNGSSNYTSDVGEQEFYSTIHLELEVQRQSFYYIFNLVLPTTMVSLVAIIGFHTPQNSVGMRESKFRLGITTLLSMGVMLLMVVNEMPKFALSSTPGQYGSFSDVPILVIFYITLIIIISLGTCTSSIFIGLERYALKYPEYSKVPYALRWLNFDFAVVSKPKKDYYDSDGDSEDEDNLEKENLLTNNHRKEKDGVNSFGNGKKARIVRFKKGKALEEEMVNNEVTYSEVHRSVSEGETFRPIPLSKLRSGSPPKTAQIRTARNSLGPLLNPESPEFSKQMERLCDNLGIIANRILTISAKLDALKAAKRKVSLGSGAPILPPHWSRIINRLENISLFLYLLSVLVMSLMLFFPSWY